MKIKKNHDAAFQPKYQFKKKEIKLKFIGRYYFLCHNFLNLTGDRHVSERDEKQEEEIYFECRKNQFRLSQSIDFVAHFNVFILEEV